MHTVPLTHTHTYTPTWTHYTSTHTHTQYTNTATHTHTRYTTHNTRTISNIVTYCIFRLWKYRDEPRPLNGLSNLSSTQWASILNTFFKPSSTEKQSLRARLIRHFIRGVVRAHTTTRKNGSNNKAKKETRLDIFRLSNWNEGNEKQQQAMAEMPSVEQYFWINHSRLIGIRDFFCCPGAILERALFVTRICADCPLVPNGWCE